MRFTAAAAFLASTLPLVARAAPAPAQNTPQTDYDAIIVGGGPAGLSALSGLARVRRKVLLIDSGVYRNAETRYMHDVLGFDGVKPDYFRWAARQQLSHYDTVTMTNGTVSRIQPQQNNAYFTVTSKDAAGKEQSLTAKKIILGTGIRDLIPDTPGLRENWAQGIFWCLWCDGHEHADQALGIIGPLTDVMGDVRNALTLNKDMVVLANGTDTAASRDALDKANPGWQKFLQLHNIKVENRVIKSIEVLEKDNGTSSNARLPSQPEHYLFRVNFDSGEPLLRNAFLTSFPNEQYSTLGQDLGVQMVSGRLAVDSTKGLMTSVPGVYAVGDCNSDGVTNVPHALFSGKRAAVYLHAQLARETAYAETGEVARRSIHKEARWLWDFMNPQHDMLNGGRFNQYGQ
ncbi:uncharacterized protein UV8b_00220 [Ustilaginoidea virens]|uniref:FAD/NAD(P)-binding domain-containing protein n=1 Tax=Ustilaginoidea virens TaxID=1159556 RepID=A0A063C1S5_USTVR|nr:uncharacterized protein UV8b_00220 [Ustilaginoidea virens]QUC15979.1 hypothetical protein UV8b_00220 [Ustilaginoidea virens]GAO17350.1 hypothetical protein UVI_02038700 [Ustilaginoidea virens]